jgi:putative endonuclease
VAEQSLSHRRTLDRRQAGAFWEKTAESFLRSNGLKLLQRNFSSRFGEIDLIMEDDRTVVFVEVKYRTSNQHGSGAEAVTFQKQGRISRTASWFLAKNPHRAEQYCRFDVISIDPLKKDQGINWIKNAFYSATG